MANGTGDGISSWEAWVIRLAGLVFVAGIGATGGKLFNLESRISGLESVAPQVQHSLDRIERKIDVLTDKGIKP